MAPRKTQANKGITRKGKKAEGRTASKRTSKDSAEKPYRKTARGGKEEREGKPVRRGASATGRGESRGDKPFRKSSGTSRSTRSDRDEKPVRRKSFARKDEGGEEKPFRRGGRDSKPFGKGNFSRSREGDNDKPRRGSRFDSNEREDKPFRKSASRRDGDDKPRRSSRFDSNEREDKPFRKSASRRDGDDKPRRSSRFDSNEREDKPFRKSAFRREGDNDKPRRGSRFDSNEREDKPFRKSASRRDGDDKPRRSSRFDSNEREEKPFRRSASRDDKPAGKRFSRSDERPSRGTRGGKFDDDRRGSRKTETRGDRFDKKPSSRGRDERPNWRDERPEIEFVELDEKAKSKRAPRVKDQQEEKARPSRSAKATEISEEMRLNRYLANAGICSRRDADKLITSGVITVNGQVMDELGYKVKPGDVVKYNGSVIKGEKMVYLVMNKPKDHITTMDDPEGRKTVMDIVANSVQERVFPVGRLDRNTTGVLIMTNDGDLAQKLTHPKYQVNKIYMAVLDKKLAPTHMDAIASGFELEDGYIQPDAVAYVEDEDRKHIGIEIHSGRNRIIHRIFEHFGYKVERLDRVSYAGLTKKDLKRGDWRFLSEKEVGELRRIVNRKTPKRYT